MLTTRSFLLTATGLFSTLLATAQTTTPAGPQPTDILSWVTWAAAAVVLLMAVITGASATAAAQQRYTEVPVTESVPEAAEAAAPMVAVPNTTPAPAFVEVPTAEALAA